MIPTPLQVLPLFDGVAGAVYEAIEHGAEYADDLLDYLDDPWYWSHTGASIDSLRFVGDDGGDPLIIDIGEATSETS